MHIHIVTVVCTFCRWLLVKTCEALSMHFSIAPERPPEGQGFASFSLSLLSLSTHHLWLSCRTPYLHAERREWRTVCWPVLLLKFKPPLLEIICSALSSNRKVSGTIRWPVLPLTFLLKVQKGLSHPLFHSHSCDELQFLLPTQVHVGPG